MNATVSPKWLSASLADPSSTVVLVLAAMGTPQESYEVIPGSQLADIDAHFSDPTDRRPHTAPANLHELFAQLGVNEDATVVVYDRHGIMVAPRIWWLARQAGIENIAVLDGGLPAWKAAGGVTETVTREKVLEWTSRSNRDPLSRHKGTLLVGSNEVREALADGKIVADARSAGRFAGTEPEPRPGLASGHMPGSINIPFTTVLDENQQLKKPDELRHMFGNHSDDEPMIFSCGSGVTACVLALAAHTAGYTNLRVYDGSWSEWGDPSYGLPVE